MQIKAIETEYGGCRFRSRLEARWAVFFDTLGVRWEYEPEGFEIPRGDETTTRYLPDFWLPDWRNYAEVKGAEPTSEYLRMLADAVDFHTTPLSDGLLLLGGIPDVTKASLVVHSRVRWEKGIAHYHVVLTRWGPTRTQGIGLAEGQELADLANRSDTLQHSPRSAVA